MPRESRLRGIRARRYFGRLTLCLPIFRRSRRRRRSPSYYSSDDNRSNKRADILRGRNAHDDRRLSRSPDEYSARRRRSPSRSRSRSRQRHHKRRRSMQRYEPAPRRQRNTSSPGSSPEAKRRKRDGSEDEAMRDSPGKQSVNGQSDGNSD